LLRIEGWFGGLPPFRDKTAEGWGTQLLWWGENEKQKRVIRLVANSVLNLLNRIHQPGQTNRVHIADSKNIKFSGAEGRHMKPCVLCRNNVD